jgi:hypothetical protein
MGALQLGQLSLAPGRPDRDAFLFVFASNGNSVNPSNGQ